MLPIKKIYIDSKHRTPDSKSSSDFKYDLPESFLMPDNAGFYVADVCVPHSWKTIEPGINDKFYLHVSNDNADPTLRPNTNYTMTLESKVYTGADLALEISYRMTAVLTGSAYAGGLTCNYNASTQSLNIVTTYSDMTFKVLTENDIKTKMDGNWVGSNYDTNDPCSINTEMLKLNQGNAGYNSFNAPFTMKYLNLQPIRNMYLHSSTIGSFSTIGLYGCRTIIKKIPVTADFNYMIIDNAMSGNDFVDCSRVTLKQLEFTLLNEDGIVVPLHNANISFSLIFDIMDTKS